MFIKPYLRSHKVFTPPKMLVKIAVNIIIPGVMNSIYEPSKPTDSIRGCVPENMLPITMIQTAG
jgi:hypothetical protein